MDLDQTDRLLLDLLQSEFPLQRRPYNALASKLGITEEDAIARTQRLKDSGIIRQIGAIFDSAKLGYQSALMAFEIPADSIDKAAQIINAHPGVSHNYQRDHAYSLWFTLTVPRGSDITKHASALAEMTGARKQLFLPTLRVFKIGVNFRMNGERAESIEGNSIDIIDNSDALAGQQRGSASQHGSDIEFRPPISDSDKKMVRLLQEDLPIIKEPFAHMAEKAGCSEGAILQKAAEFLEKGVMRRFAAILRHTQAGYSHNMLTVWPIDPAKAHATGRALASFDSVSHCYLRPTAPDWPYNLYAMMHARTSEEAGSILKEMSEETAIKNYLLLHTLKEFKKCRVKYFDETIESWESKKLP